MGKMELQPMEKTVLVRARTEEKVPVRARMEKVPDLTEMERVPALR